MRALGIAERKDRERQQRERRVVAAARAIAEAEGWPFVTIRRLAEEIEFSQPVVYSHFESRDAIIAAVAVEGFGELSAALGRARRGAAAAHRLLKVSTAYLAFARANPALYEAMFTMRVGLRFAQADTTEELTEAFTELAAALGVPSEDADLATETLWAALHGLAALESSGRIRPAMRDERLRLLVEVLLGHRRACLAGD